MRRLTLVTLFLVERTSAMEAVATASGQNGQSGTYKVRAIFDDASFAVPGEQVRIAGAPVGSIASLDVCVARTAACAAGTQNKAAVTLQINDERFTPFHTNATCAIRPQSLIGEMYVDCDPGTAAAPPLTRIDNGPGKGTYYLPVTRTHSPVDFDIAQDVWREPVTQRLAIILNQLGTGLAARGSDLNAVIHRADPALGNTDKVLKILAGQNRALAKLATDSAAVLTPLAQQRKALADFIVQANTTAVASAARAKDISKSIQLLPGFLGQLRPLMVDLGTLADQGTPLASELGTSAAALGREFTELTPFAKAARNALIDLGASAQQSQGSLVATIPLANQLNKLGTQLQPAATELDQLTSSLNSTGAVGQLMALLFNGTAAANGFDSLGHYARDQLLVSDCTGFATTPVPGCSANFPRGGTATATAASAGAKTGATTATAKTDTSAAPDNSILATATAGASVAPNVTGSFQRLLDYLIGPGG
jgi:ABC-type transporter Mla subunit MlaD